jgi:hypothetical protein
MRQIDSQNSLIIKHLQAGKKLTGLEALEMFDCFRLPARVFDLIERGHNIEGVKIKTKSGKYVKQYHLNDPPSRPPQEK